MTNVDRRGATARTRRLAWLLAIAAAGAAGCAGMMSRAPSSDEVRAELKSSFAARGGAGLDRLDQTELQAACSEYATSELPKPLRERLEQAAMASVKYPADGKYLGDWRRGEAIAQNGRGLQFSDPPGRPGGANCYACHQLRKDELAYGTIGPSLHQYGKQRGQSPETLRYTWARLWNPNAFNACNAMPRFGDAHILDEQQLKDVMALLLDPASPVNK